MGRGQRIASTAGAREKPTHDSASWMVYGKYTGALVVHDVNRGVARVPKVFVVGKVREVEIGRIALRTLHEES
jgi:hypothetical protein